MTGPCWLVGGGAVLTVVGDAPTVWLVSIDDPAARARAGAIAVSANELAGVAAHPDAGQRLMRRRLAKMLLAAAVDCHPDAVTIERNAAGAPVVTTPAAWHLSVAARWPECAIGVAREPLGVDLERFDGGALPPDLLTEAERGDGKQDRRAAAHRWAAKEAHAKWTGRPLDLDPAAIETGRPPLVTSRFGTTRCWRRDAPDYVAAVCTAA